MTAVSPQGRRVVRNLVIMGAGELLSVGVSVVTTIAVARYLGVEGYGRYAYVIALVGIFQLVASAGLHSILIREIVARAGDVRRLVGSAQSLTWALSCVTFLVIAAVVELTGAEGEVRVATYIAAVGVLALIQTFCVGGVFRAYEEMEVNAAGMVAHKIVLLALVGAGVWMDGGLLAMCGAVALANVFLWAYYVVRLTRRHFWPRPHFDVALWWELLTASLPLSVGALLRRAAWHIDVLLLTAFGLVQAAGYFSAGYRVVRSLTLGPMIVAQVVFPAFSRLARLPTASFLEAQDKTLRFLFVLAVPAALVVAASAERVVTLAYGRAFAPAGVSLAVMSGALLFLFPAALFSTIFTAAGKQQFHTYAAAVGLTVNAGVDVALIPSLAHVGAAVGTLAGEAAFFATGFLLLKRLNPGLSLVRVTWRPGVAGLGMGTVLLAVRQSALPTFALGVLFAAGLYAALALAVRAVTTEELTVLWKALPGRRRSLAPQPTTVSPGDIG